MLHVLDAHQCASSSIQLKYHIAENFHKSWSFIYEIKLIYTRAMPLHDNLWKLCMFAKSFLFIRESFYPQKFSVIRESFLYAPIVFTLYVCAFCSNRKVYPDTHYVTSNHLYSCNMWWNTLKRIFALVWAWLMRFNAH